MRARAHTLALISFSRRIDWNIRNPNTQILPCNQIIARFGVCPCRFDYSLMPFNWLPFLHRLTLITPMQMQYNYNETRATTWFFVGKLRIQLKEWKLTCWAALTRARSTELSQLANLRHVRKHNCSNYAYEKYCVQCRPVYGTETKCLLIHCRSCLLRHRTENQMHAVNANFFFNIDILNDETLILLLQRWHEARDKIVRYQCGQIINSNEFPIKSIHNCTHISGPPV